MQKKPRFHCKSEAQKRAIRRSYAQKQETTNETYPHFRFYLKSRHPALIISERSDEEYNYRKVTHSAYEGRHLNEKVEPNPNPKDFNPMYIVHRTRHDYKSNFGKRYPWIYPDKKKK